VNRLAIITAFLGGVKNRYMTYQPERGLAEKLAMAAAVKGCDGVELCYPADFTDPAQLKTLLQQHGLGISAVNFRSRRTGQWWRGSFSSDSAQERQEVVDDLRRAMDSTAELGCNRITTCPLNDGTDFPFEANPVALYDHAAETLTAACAHNRHVRICLEFKRSDPVARTLFGTAGETAAFCLLAGADNLGATLDIGHALCGGESPAQAAALLARANRLFYVHLNDNDGHWDWDMIPGIHHTWAFVEFFYTLDKLGYDDDWYAFDVVVKEHDTVETFDTVMALTRQLEGIAARIDTTKMDALMLARNPGKTMGYLYGMMRDS
jgi:xylose isomerase